MRYAPNLAKDLLAAAASFGGQGRHRERTYNWE
jgi:hypothetical protein